MSVEALRWARSVQPVRLGGPAKAVLRDLADRANRSAVCWPSVATIAASTDLSERTVQRALRLLEAEGLIVTTMTGRSSRYVLQIPVTSEGHEMPPGGQEVPFRGDTESPKASRSFKAKQTRARAREEEQEPGRVIQNAGAYQPFKDEPPAASGPDAEMLALARAWREGHTP